MSNLYLQAVRLSILIRATAMLIQVIAHRSQGVSVSILVRATAMLIQVIAHCSQGFMSVSIFKKLGNNHCAVIQSKLLSVASGLSPLHKVVQLISAAVIIFEHSFYIFDKWRYLQDKGQSDPSFYVALEQYMSSPHAAAVVKGVSDPVHAYEQVVATFTKEEEYLSSQANVELINAVLEIT
ncbi:uncharacterized protein F5147DRAFT_781781 [Suillus discolor]|uniref:Uncharacterized protein n=1 Tax=Suillus discolor TaxID=1912936 RepID=A0A9P7ES38_9AGAM|nr:uncharacterized protein F5147DRAFT_781781 [Suillus discolor]KAG2086075.1 hypothetical protein F5147DRAFT_781781 [Suillus discolor]